MGDYVLIKNMRPGMRNIACTFIVLEKAADGEVYHAKGGSKIRSCRVADKSGSINFSAWDEIGESVESGEVYRLNKGYVSLWKGSLTLYLGKYGVLERLGDICMVFNELPNMSDPHADFLKDLKEQQQHMKKHSGKQKDSNSRSNSPEPMAGSREDSDSSATLKDHTGGRGTTHRHTHIQSHPLSNSRRNQSRFHPYSNSQHKSHERSASKSH